MHRSAEAGYPRGDETRARIVDTAIGLFAARGFDAVTTREIATAAGVPQASLRYYFQHKQGLYVACLETLQAMVLRAMEPALVTAEAALADGHVDVPQMIDRFCALQAALIDAMVGRSDRGTAALFLIRHDLPSQADVGKLAGAQDSIRRMTDCFANLMIRISRQRLDASSATRIAGLINGQITNVYLRRDRLEMDGWDMTPARLDWIKRVIRQHTVAILDFHAGAGAPWP